VWIFFIFQPVRFKSGQLISFPLRWCISSGRRRHNAAPCHISSHEIKMSSLSLLRFIISHLKLKLKHWIYITVVGHPSRTARLPPSTVIKRSSQSWSLFSPLPPSCNHVSILPLTSQSITPSKLHSSMLFSFTIIPRLLSLRKMTPTVIN
jgi:hypothetical protein